MASRTATTHGQISSTVRRHGTSVARASIRRFIDADGTSHTRALAYQSVFVALSGFIGLIGLTAVLGVRQLRLAVQHMASTLAPGPSGKLLQQAANHGASSGATAAVFGLAAALVRPRSPWPRSSGRPTGWRASQTGAARSGTSRPSGWRSRPGCCSRSAG